MPCFCSEEDSSTVNVIIDSKHTEIDIISRLFFIFYKHLYIINTYTCIANMKKQRGRAEYIGLTMAKPLMDEVDEWLKQHPSYRSKNEFVKTAIREKLNNKTL